jgi:hypothetical protein
VLPASVASSLWTQSWHQVLIRLVCGNNSSEEFRKCSSTLS